MGNWSNSVGTLALLLTAKKEMNGPPE
jgi:hypothetical protein